MLTTHKAISGKRPQARRIISRSDVQDYFSRLTRELRSHWRAGMLATFVGSLPSLVTWAAKLTRDEFVVRTVEGARLGRIVDAAHYGFGWSVAHPVMSGSGALGLWIAFCAWLSTGKPFASPSPSKPRFPLDLDAHHGMEGLELWMHNTTAEPVKDLQLSIVDLRMWYADKEQFVQTTGIHGPGPFVQVYLPRKYGLGNPFPNELSMFSFAKQAGSMYEISGASVDGTKREYRFSPGGIFRATLLLESTLASENRYFCFRAGYGRLEPLFFSSRDKARPSYAELNPPSVVPHQSTPIR